MSYPNAYCLKCGAHTETEQKKTLVLKSNRRALNGLCHKCGHQVYKILPKKVEAKKAGPSVKRPPISKQPTSEIISIHANNFCRSCRKLTRTYVSKSNGQKACFDCKTPAVKRVRPESSHLSGMNYSEMNWAKKPAWTRKIQDFLVYFSTTLALTSFAVLCYMVFTKG